MRWKLLTGIYGGSRTGIRRSSFLSRFAGMVGTGRHANCLKPVVPWAISEVGTMQFSKANSLMKLEHFEVKLAGEWVSVRGLALSSGWLDWKCKDGTQGLSRPGKWRKKAEPQAAKPKTNI